MESIYINWSETEDYEMTGAQLMQQKAEEEKEALNKEGKDAQADEIYPDDIYEENCPVMNYGYPLDRDNISDDIIIKVCKETNCTIISNEDQYFLALTGGGMNLTQDIVYAYFLVYGYVPYNVVYDMSYQRGLSISKSKFDVLSLEIIKTLEQEKRSIENKLKELKFSQN